MEETGTIRNEKKRGFIWEMRHNGTLYLMCVPALLLLLLFAYLPMGGMYMAFTKFNVVDGVFGSPFVGLQNFSYFFSGNPYAWNAIKNTLIINFWGIILGTILPVTLAIFMNEMKNGLFKKVSQSAMFFPYFLSWVVVGAILYGFLTSNFRIDRRSGELVLTGANGVMNRLLIALGQTPVRWYAEPVYWKPIIILLDVWKWAGYNSIIYMAAMAGFDGSLIFKPLTRNFAEEQYTWVASGDLVVFGEESKQAYSYAHTQAFQEVAKFNHEMYLDNLYNDDVAIKYNGRDSRMQTGLYLWVEGSLGKENEIAGSVQVADPNARLANYLLAPEKPRYINATGGEVLCIPYSAKNPEGALKFLAWLWGNQDNYLFCLYGEKGKDWDLDENGRLITLSETARGDGYFYEWMFRNANYQVFSEGVTDEYIEMYKHWDDEAIPSAMLGFAFDNTGFEAIETACTEAFKKLTPILYGYVDFETEYPKAIAELEAAGINEYVAEVNRQLAEFIGSK